MAHDAPPGYARIAGPNGEGLTALAGVAHEIGGVLKSATLYETASRSGGKVFQGRAAAYEFQLGAYRAVVRHNWHGGAFAFLSRDVFVGAGRTGLELAASERLRASGVPTPRMLAIVIYPAAAVFSRSDVATELIPDARDLSAYLCEADAAIRRRAIATTGRLLDRLAAVGARHHDLNVKNVLLRSGSDAEFEPYVLDVDRVTFHTPHDPRVMRWNVERLLRSARKWRRLRGARVTDAELAGWRVRCRDASTPPRPHPT